MRRAAGCLMHFCSAYTAVIQYPVTPCVGHATLGDVGVLHLCMCVRVWVCVAAASSAAAGTQPAWQAPAACRSAQRAVRAQRSCAILYFRRLSI